MSPAEQALLAVKCLVSAVLLVGNQCMCLAQRCWQKSRWHAQSGRSSLLCLYCYSDRLLCFWLSQDSLQAQGRRNRLRAWTAEADQTRDISRRCFQGKDAYLQLLYHHRQTSQPGTQRPRHKALSLLRIWAQQLPVQCPHHTAPVARCTPW